MDIVTLLAIAALACGLGGFACIAIGIKWRNEDWAWMLIWGVIACWGGAAWCVQEAVKRGDAREHQRSPVPVDARPAQ
jgi:hypothetical protein